ncbi:MAG: PilZ domain-containing protein [Desulfobacterales bacterium]|nr:MAG: PilZ domain-containing protein [Desulfobacterales bacterium]
MEKRKTTRTQLWIESEATVNYQGRQIKGKVGDIGAKGMFLETPEKIPEKSQIELTIVFQSKKPVQLSDLKGTVVRCGKNGVGIAFKQIDMSRFRECLLAIMEG